jgi:progressive ankylosis protein
MSTYWRFYWPLALTGLAMVLSTQFQNATLARYPNAVQELAIFALAQGTFQFFNAALGFTPQLSNVYARSRHGFRTSFAFILTTTAMLSVLQSELAFSDLGRRLLAFAYDQDSHVLDRVREYLGLLIPVLFLNATRLFFNGTLVQARLTGWVTLLNVLYLCTTLLVLMMGLRGGWPVTWTIVGAQTAAAIVHLLASLFVRNRFYRWPDVAEHSDLGWGELVRFFVPVTTNGVMFALSRPVLYAFVGRTPGGLVSIAALRVGFDFSMMFQQAANQFRHFFVTFGLDDLPCKRRFMALVCIGITSIMLVVAATPLSNWVLTRGLGIDQVVKSRSVQVILIMCALPTLIIFRNYFHGLLLVQRRTLGMATGGILRVVGIFVFSQLLLSAGALNHVTAALVLLSGFAIEALVVLRAGTRPQFEDLLIDEESRTRPP